jgi:hypothetical protein
MENSVDFIELHLRIHGLPMAMKKIVHYRITLLLGFKEPHFKISYWELVI